MGKVRMRERLGKGKRGSKKVRKKGKENHLKEKNKYTIFASLLDRDLFQKMHQNITLNLIQQYHV